MTTDALKQLWMLTFGDSAEFVDLFFATAYDPRRCRFLSNGELPTAALYWLDTEYRGQKFAYLYGVATHPAHRGKGLCRTLMEDTHAHLKLRGYDGVLLVPQTEALRQMYRKMGYRDCTAIREFACEAPGDPVALRRIDRDEYAEARRAFLPADSVVQEDENIAYLEMMAFFYRGDKFLLAARREGNHLFCPEILGDISAAPGILAALNCASGTFRTPGAGMDFAMFLALEENARAPGYFGLAFD